MSPFVTPLEIANEVQRRRPTLPVGELYTCAEWHDAEKHLIVVERANNLGRWLFIRRKGPKLKGRVHTLHGKIVDLDGQQIKVEYHSELGKHLEWFYPHEAHIHICERNDNARTLPQALRD